MDSFRKAYLDQVCTTHLSQSGKAALEPALGFCRDGEKLVRNIRELRRRLLESWRDLLGPALAPPRFLLLY